MAAHGIFYVNSSLINYSRKNFIEFTVICEWLIIGNEVNYAGSINATPNSQIELKIDVDDSAMAMAMK